MPCSGMPSKSCGLRTKLRTADQVHFGLLTNYELGD